MARRAQRFPRSSDLVILRRTALASSAGRCHCGDGWAVRQERSPGYLIEFVAAGRGGLAAGRALSPASRPALVTAARLHSDLAPCGRAPGGRGRGVETAWHRAQSLRVPLALARARELRRPPTARCRQPQPPVALLCSVLLRARFAPIIGHALAMVAATIATGRDSGLPPAAPIEAARCDDWPRERRDCSRRRHAYAMQS